MRAFLVYSTARVGVFLGTAALLYAVGFRRLALVLVALVISMPLSYVLLRRQRLAFAVDVERRVKARQARRQDLRERLRGADPPPHPDDSTPDPPRSDDR